MLQMKMDLNLQGFWQVVCASCCSACLVARVSELLQRF